MMSAATNPATVDECLRVGVGFSQGDRNWIAEQFVTLDSRLATFHADTTELEVSVKDREIGHNRHLRETPQPDLADPI
jgi:hypothetical protein